MKHSLTSIGLAALMAVMFSASGGRAVAATRVPMSIKVLSVTPHSVTGKNEVIWVQVRFTGVRMDPLHIGTKPIAGHGYMQVYLDRIPASAYTTGATKRVVVEAATSTFHFVLSSYWRRAARGHHRFLVALAKDNKVLYRVKPAGFSLTVK